MLSFIRQKLAQRRLRSNLASFGKLFSRLLPGEKPPLFRLHHYGFVHKTLPALFFLEPASVLDGLMAPRGDEMLRVIWEDAGGRALREGGRKQGAYVSPDGLARVDDFRVDDWTVAVIALPEPLSLTEAWFVALALKTPGGQPASADGAPPAKPEVRYYTLEKGLDLFGESAPNMLCVWFPDGSRRNFGQGFEATAEAFVAAVSERLKQEEISPAELAANGD